MASVFRSSFRTATSRNFHDGSAAAPFDTSPTDTTIDVQDH
jgi:hypothetical protein